MTIAWRVTTIIRHELGDCGEQFLFNFFTIHAVSRSKPQQALLLAFAIAPDASNDEFDRGRGLITLLDPVCSCLDARRQNPCWANPTELEPHGKGRLRQFGTAAWPL